MCGFNILIFSCPSFHTSILKCSSVRETQEPGFPDSREFIHSIQIQRGFFLTLSTGEEEHSNQSWGNSSWKSFSGSSSNFFWGDLRSINIMISGSYHVGFQQAAFPEDIIVGQSLHASSQNSFGNLLANFDSVSSISQNFWFHNRYQPIFLANHCISRQSPGGFLDSQRSWSTVWNF